MTSIYKTKILQGHERPLKDIQFSPDGKYIFSASSDRTVIQWDYKINKKVFTYNHQASVNVICISKKNNYMFTGDSTGCFYIWDIITNQLQKKIMFEAKYNIRSINLSSSEKYILITFAERIKKSSSFIGIYEIENILSKCENSNSAPAPPLFKKINCEILETKFCKSHFTNNDKNILVSREDGVLELFDFPEGKSIFSQKFHNDEILDFDVNDEYSIIIANSKDGEMSLINLNTFQLLKKFKPTNPVRNLNSCRIAVIDNPYYKIPGASKKLSVDALFDLNNLDLNSLNFVENEEDKEKAKKFGNKKKIILAITAGGQDSKFVTTTNQKEGGFEIIIYNAVSGEKMSEFLDHFGPINTLAVYKSILASGAEDATVRVHQIEHYLFS